LAVCGDGLEDVVGGFGAGVPRLDPGVHVGFEVGDAVVGGAAEFAVGELGEPALDEVEPGRAGRREVQVEPGVLEQPLLDGGCLVVA
jgi:hypothetical protein